MKRVWVSLNAVIKGTAINVAVTVRSELIVTAHDPVPLQPPPDQPPKAEPDLVLAIRVTSVPLA